MSEERQPRSSRPAESPKCCGYGSCDKKPGHDGIHRCRCGKPVDQPHERCAWHTPGGE